MSTHLVNTIPLLKYLKDKNFINNIDNEKLPINYKSHDNSIFGIPQFSKCIFEISIIIDNFLKIMIDIYNFQK